MAAAEEGAGSGFRPNSRPMAILELYEISKDETKLYSFEFEVEDAIQETSDDTNLNGGRSPPDMVRPEHLLEDLPRLSRLDLVVQLRAPQGPWAVVGGTQLCWLYPLLTYSSYTPDLYTLDLVSSSSEFKQGPPMKQKRCFPIAVACDGHLYVLGGGQNRDGKPFGEVFHFDTKTWENLKEPNPKWNTLLGIQWGNSPYPIVWGACRKEIVVGYGPGKDLFHFNIGTQQWRNSHLPELPLPCAYIRGRGVAFKNMLMWFSTTGHLVAYDLDCKQWILSQDEFIDEQFESELDIFKAPPLLAHIRADLFCLFWKDHPYSKHLKINTELRWVRIHCFKFQVSVGPDEKDLCCKVLGCECRLYEGNCFIMDASVTWLSRDCGSLC